MLSSKSKITVIRKELKNDEFFSFLFFYPFFHFLFNYSLVLYIILLCGFFFFDFYLNFPPTFFVFPLSFFFFLFSFLSSVFSVAFHFRYRRLFLSFVRKINFKANVRLTFCNSQLKTTNDNFLRQWQGQPRFRAKTSPIIQTRTCAPPKKTYYSLRLMGLQRIPSYMLCEIISNISSAESNVSVHRGKAQAVAVSLLLYSCAN